jgi:hypothetical protein
MIPSTVERVPRRTAGPVNDAIRRRTAEDVALHAAAGGEAVDRRLEELDREWDVERLIEAEAPVTILAGLLLARVAGRAWLALPLFASTMLLVHALHGWYPLLPLLRRMGIRTAAEINRERYALRAVRGDFRHGEA